MFTTETCTGVLFSWGRCENHKAIAAILSLININDCKITFETNPWSYFLICYPLNSVLNFLYLPIVLKYNEVQTILFLLDYFLRNTIIKLCKVILFFLDFYILIFIACNSCHFTFYYHFTFKKTEFRHFLVFSFHYHGNEYP